MDDDLQHPVSEIAPMLAALTPEFDVVYGAPREEQHGLLRDLASRLTKIALAGAMGADTARNAGAFRVFRTRLRDGFRDYRSPFVSIDVLLTWTTSRFTAIKVRHEPRAAGRSGYTVRKLVRHAFNLMTGFSTLPFQVASLAGFVVVLLGVVILAWVLGHYILYGRGTPGFAFLACIITIFSGVQLFALGIFGEYLARMHFRTMDRPPYVIGAVVNLGAPGDHVEPTPFAERSDRCLTAMAPIGSWPASWATKGWIFLSALDAQGVRVERLSAYDQKGDRFRLSTRSMRMRQRAPSLSRSGRARPLSPGIVYFSSAGSFLLRPDRGEHRRFPFIRCCQGIEVSRPP